MHSAAQSLVCFNPACRRRYAITDVLYNCTECGGLLEAAYEFAGETAASLKKLFRERRMSNAPLDASGVWRYRELFPFLDDYSPVVTLREGNTPLLDAPLAAGYGGLGRVVVQAPGIQSHRFVQRQRHDVRGGAGAQAGDAAGGLRIDGKHFGIDGGVRGGGRTRPR